MAEKRSCYCEETLKEAVRLVNVEGFSFGEAQLATGIFDRGGGMLSGPVDSELINKEHS